jgi:hypothetical protein
MDPLGLKVYTAPGGAYGLPPPENVKIPPTQDAWAWFQYRIVQPPGPCRYVGCGWEFNVVVIYWIGWKIRDGVDPGDPASAHPGRTYEQAEKEHMNDYQNAFDERVINKLVTLFVDRSDCERARLWFIYQMGNYEDEIERDSNRRRHGGR